MEKQIKFTEKEIQKLSKIEIGKPLKDKHIMNKLEKYAIAKLYSQTGQIVRWNGYNLKAWHVDECERFEVNGMEFREEYRSGCFQPYIVRTK